MEWYHDIFHSGISQGLGMIKFLLFFFFISPPLFSDITFKGICGSYDYSLDIPSSKYYGGFCKDNGLFVYYDASKTDYIRGVYADPQVSTSIDIYSISTGRKYKTLQYHEGDIKFIGNPSTQFLYGLAGLLCGLSLLYPIMRS
jgi:hypothetical protein